MTEFTLGFLLALVCAAFWAGLDITRKKLGRHMTAVGAVAWLMFMHIIFINPVLVAGEFFDGGGDVITDMILVGYPELPWVYWLPTVASIMLNLVANFLFLRAVQISPLSLTTPYLAFTPVFTALVALVFLGQIPTTYGWLGIAVVCLGAFFMNPGNKADGWIAPLKALWSERGSFYMLIVALTWSITPILDKTASEMTSPLWHTMALATGVAAVFFVLRRARDGSFGPLFEEFRAVPWWLALGGGFAVGAMV